MALIIFVEDILFPIDVFIIILLSISAKFESIRAFECLALISLVTSFICGVIALWKKNENMRKLCGFFSLLGGMYDNSIKPERTLTSLNFNFAKTVGTFKLLKLRD